MGDLAGFQRDFARSLTSDVESTQARGFAVYRNNSARGTVEALRATFPTVDMLLGSEMFTAVALDYRDLHPPVGPVLSDYGREFPDFVRAQPWHDDLPYLADVALLDRLWLESFLGPDQPPRPPASGSQPRLRLHPATRCAWLGTPAMTIWQAHRNSGQVSDLEPEWQAEGALFCRSGLRVIDRRIDRIDQLLLQQAAAGPTIDDCLATLSSSFPDQDAAAHFRNCLATGALVIA